VASERNPWLASPAGDSSIWASFQPDIAGAGGSTEQAKAGNALAHQQEGQNVMFLDTHVEFEKRAYCSVEDDNIYTVGTTEGGAEKGTMPTLSSVPLSRKDSLLMHDPETFSGPTTPSRPSGS